MNEQGQNQKLHRRSIRLKDYDYSSEGSYFLTIVSHKRECFFGQIQNGRIQLNEFGEIVREEWIRSAKIRKEMLLEQDEFVIMPNHIHGIVHIVESEKPVRAYGTSRKNRSGVQKLRPYALTTVFVTIPIKNHWILCTWL